MAILTAGTGFAPATSQQLDDIKASLMLPTNTAQAVADASSAAASAAIAAGARQAQLPAAQLAALAALAQRPGWTDIANTVRAINAIGDGTDTTEKYLWHRDITPTDWPHIAGGGWQLEFFGIFEIGIKGATDLSQVTVDGTVVPTLSVRISTLQDAGPGNVLVPFQIAAPAMSPAGDNGKSFAFTLLSMSDEADTIRALNGGFGLSSTTGGAVSKNTIALSNGLRMQFGVSWAAAAANHTVKMLGHRINMY